MLLHKLLQEQMSILRPEKLNRIIELANRYVSICNGYRIVKFRLTFQFHSMPFVFSVDNQQSNSHNVRISYAY